MRLARKLLSWALGHSWFFCSYGGADIASGREMSDCDGVFGGGRLEGKAARKHHRRSTRARSRQERTSRPRLTILNVSSWAGRPAGTGLTGRSLWPGLTLEGPAGVQHG